MKGAEQDIRALVDAELASGCPCDTCERYRKYFDAKVRQYVEKLRRQLGLDEGSDHG